VQPTSAANKNQWWGINGASVPDLKAHTQATHPNAIALLAGTSPVPMGEPRTWSCSLQSFYSLHVVTEIRSNVVAFKGALFTFTIPADAFFLPHLNVKLTHNVNKRLAKKAERASDSNHASAHVLSVHILSNERVHMTDKVVLLLAVDAQNWVVNGFPRAYSLVVCV
jgi:hypothetical protein